MAIVISLTNQKGGVGKTTTACSLCGVFAYFKKKVLAIDLDPQGNLTFSLGAKDDGLTVHDVLTDKCMASEAVQKTKNNCDVIASNILLSGTELELTSVGREFILKEKLSGILDNYDYIVIDTPPALSILTINAYIASNDLIIPMIPEILSLQGITQLRDTIKAVKKYYNKDLKIRGILLNKYNPRFLLTREVEELAGMVAGQLETQIINTKITAGITAAEAPAHQETIITYSPKAKVSEDYFKLAEELYGLKKEIVKNTKHTKKGV